MTANFKMNALLVVVISILGRPEFWLPSKVHGVKTRLSEYAFFEGNISALSPAANVFSYEVNAPLFSDYAEKARFIYLPPGQSMEYSAEQAFECPTGAVIIKKFYYWNDTRFPRKYYGIPHGKR
jgi:hypothetical protein